MLEHSWVLASAEGATKPASCVEITRLRDILYLQDRTGITQYPGRRGIVGEDLIVWLGLLFRHVWLTSPFPAGVADNAISGRWH